MAIKHLADHFGFGFTQLRELSGHMRHGAVLLTQLLTDRAGAHRCSVSPVGEYFSQRSCRSPLGVVCHGTCVVTFDKGHAAASELDHSCLTLRLLQEPQGLNSEVIVLLFELFSPGICQRERTRRAAAPTATEGTRRDTLDCSERHEMVEMSTYACGREAQPIAELRSGGGPRLKDRGNHAFTGRDIARLVDGRCRLLGTFHDFHNTSVTLMIPAIQVRPALPGLRRDPIGAAQGPKWEDSQVPTEAVTVDNLGMRYGDTVAVDDLSLTVAQGSVTAVLGPNGAGKTTTLETCEGYRTPQSGAVRVLGHDPVRERAALMPRIGVMLQSGGAWSGARPDEMLRHIAAMYAHPLPVAHLVERLRLHEFTRTPYRRLSGGQAQRLGLAMALVGRPELVFVDEPTAGLDPAIRREVWALLGELRDDGVTVVLTTHYLEEAERLADAVHVLSHGRLVASGAPSELTRQGRATIRLVVTRPFPVDSPEQLRTALGVDTEITALSSHALSVSAPAAPATLRLVSQWCERHDIVPESLTMGTATLEDVFLEVTGSHYGGGDD